MTTFLGLLLMVAPMLPFHFQPKSPIGPYEGAWKAAPIPSIIIKGPAAPDSTERIPDEAPADSTLAR